MWMSRFAVSSCLCLSVAVLARGASIDVTGANGAPGTAADSVNGISATPGGWGEGAAATASDLDPANQAAATGGAGGTGGAQSGFLSSAFLPGAAGGFGGSAITNASSSSATEGVSASASAHGGAGGSGGDNGYHFGPYPTYPYYPNFAAGGDGGRAEAHSTASSSAGPAQATAQAVGGLGGFGGSTDPAYEYAGGATGNAFAAAESSASSDSSADARASGSHALAFSDSTSESGNATAFTRTTGVIGAAGAREPTDWVPLANATARSLGAGNAQATAITTGNTSKYVSTGYVGGASRALASAYSDSGAATAHATQIAGDAPPSYPAGASGYPDVRGGPGVASDAHDLVQGSTRGLLTLIQDAVASDAKNGYNGGAATSTLGAVNPLGGDLHAEVTADAGNGGQSCNTRLGYPICTQGTGGNAVASVTANGGFPASADARAHALGGHGSSYLSGIGTISGNGGSSTANATATGGHSLFAHADSLAQLGAAAGASANALGAGGIAGARAQLGFAALPANGTLEGTNKTLIAEAGLRVASQQVGVPPLPTEGGWSRIFARPEAGDVDTWLAGNPNAESALAGRDVLALGSLGMAGSYRGPTSYSEGEDDTLRLQGSASLDLTAASFGAGDTLALALLDPVGSFSILDLSLTRNGAELFHQSLAGDAAGLDDVVLELGQIFAPGAPAATYTLSWLFETPALYYSTTQTSFSLDFAFIGNAPVPEPSAAALVGLGVCVLLRAVRRSRFSAA